MATVTVTHSKVSSGTVNAAVEVDLADWNDDHVVAGLENVDNTSDADKPVSTATQTALDAKQNLDATLTALAGLNSTAGIVVQTAADSFTKRTLTGTANQVTVTNGDGVSGAPTISLPNSIATIPVLAGGRLTLTSATPITESDVIGATNIYYTPASHDYIDIYDGSIWTRNQFTELTLALDSTGAHSGYHQSGKNFFLGVINDGGTLRLASSVAWSSDTATGTGAGTCEVEMFEGRMVNKVTMTVRFGSASGNTVSVAARQFTIVGGFRASADGQTEDSFKKRFVSNLQNPTLRPMLAADALTNYVYTTSTLRQAGADAANQLDYFHCVSGRNVTADVVATFIASAGAVNIAIGLDSTSTSSGFKGNHTSTVLNAGFAKYNGFPGIGRHYLARLEYGGGSGTTTWYSNSGANALIMGETLN